MLQLDSVVLLEIVGLMVLLTAGVAKPRMPKRNPLCRPCLRQALHPACSGPLHSAFSACLPLTRPGTAPPGRRS